MSGKQIRIQLKMWFQVHINETVQHASATVQKVSLKPFRMELTAEGLLNT